MYNSPALTRVTTDVLIIGGGFAGLSAGIRAAQAGYQTIIVDKAKITRSGCSSFLAGVMAACCPEDDHDLWLQEIVKGGNYLNDQIWTARYLEDGYQRLQDIDTWGQAYNRQPVLKDANGNWVRRKARGNIGTAAVLVNAREMMAVLRRKARDSGVIMHERVMINSLITHDQQAVAALGLQYRTGEVIVYSARAIVLAAGGCGFKGFLMGHHNLTGDLLAAAFQTGAHMACLENSHSNTTARDFDIHGLNIYVSAGGKFINNAGREFMADYYPQLGNRAPLPALVHAMSLEIAAGRAPLYLDITSASPADEALARQILPESFRIWDQAGINPFHQPIPWMPAFKGTTASGGGLLIDHQCRCNLAGLYAAGDNAIPSAAGTGGHIQMPGLWALVSGWVAGEEAAVFASQTKTQLSQDPAIGSQVDAAAHQLIKPMLHITGTTPEKVMQQLQQLLFRTPVIYLRHAEALEQVSHQLTDLAQEVPLIKAADYHHLVKAHEVDHMITIARAIISSAVHRTESRGFHFRTDYPLTDNINWLKLTIASQQETGMQVWSQELSFPFVQPPAVQRPYLDVSLGGD